MNPHTPTNSGEASASDSHPSSTSASANIEPTLAFIPEDTIMEPTTNLRAWLAAHSRVFHISNQLGDAIDTLNECLDEVSSFHLRTEFLNLLLAILYDYVELPRAPRFVPHYFMRTSRLSRCFIFIVNDLLSHERGLSRTFRFFMLRNRMTGTSELPILHQPS